MILIGILIGLFIFALYMGPFTLSLIRCIKLIHYCILVVFT